MVTFMQAVESYKLFGLLMLFRFDFFGLFVFGYFSRCVMIHCFNLFSLNFLCWSFQCLSFLVRYLFRFFFNLQDCLLISRWLSGLFFYSLDTRKFITFNLKIFPSVYGVVFVVLKLLFAEWVFFILTWNNLISFSFMCYVFSLYLKINSQILAHITFLYVSSVSLCVFHLDISISDTTQRCVATSSKVTIRFIVYWYMVLQALW